QRETPVEQRGALLPAALRRGLRAQQRDHEPASVPRGAAHETVPGQLGEAGLAAQRARVVVDQLVLVLELEAALLERLLRRHLRAAGQRVPAEVVPGETDPGDQGQVVRAGELARTVQTGGRDGVRLERA